MNKGLFKERTDAAGENLPGKKKRTWRGAGATLLLVASVVLCIFVLGQVLTKGYLSVGGYSLFRVVTGSMEPEIPVGALMIVQDTPMEEIRERDIVTYHSREQGDVRMIITHRVVGLYDGANGQRYLETKGDANQHADSSYVDETRLIGRVIYHTKEGNLLAGILTVLTSKMGFLACVVLPCLVVGTLVMRDCLRTVRQELDEMNREISRAQKREPEPAGQTESYEEMCSRLREELLEELKQGAEPETRQQEPGAEQ
ncbi:MAG: signal peptidase I [Ruminococcaceae bacterium]|nr:signal peptidase I [Oscillospiraceae bacterium]